MSRRLPKPAATALTLAATLVLVATVAADDVILIPNATVKAPGGRIRGAVESESPTVVNVKPLTGAAQAVPVDQIDSISYDGTPAGVTVAKSQESAGNLTRAIDEYQKAATQAAEKPYIAQSIQMTRFRLLAQLNPTEAIAGLEAFVRANPTSRHLAPALELLIRLLLDRKEYDRADRAVGQLDKVSWAADHAAVLRARILTKRGKPAEALAALGKLTTGAAATTAKGREVRLARAEALVAEQKYDDAEKAAREVIRAADVEDAEAQAAAHNTLGDCLHAAGKPRDALLAYLHTDLLYAKDKDQHARALAQIARLYRELKRDDRADEALGRLKQEYPNSPYLAAEGGAAPAPRRGSVP